LERGFKADANKISLEVRAELGLARHSPLSPFALADSLLIPVFTLRQVGPMADAGDHGVVCWRTREESDEPGPAQPQAR